MSKPLHAFDVLGLQLLQAILNKPIANMEEVDNRELLDNLTGADIAREEAGIVVGEEGIVEEEVGIVEEEGSIADSLDLAVASNILKLVGPMEPNFQVAFLFQHRLRSLDFRV